jgi:hypothetical protein
MIAIEIREALEKSYPDVTDLEFSIEHSGSAHEHPLIAIGVLLISSIVLETTAPAKLAEFTRYSERFMRAVARNMETVDYGRMIDTIVGVGPAANMYPSPRTGNFGIMPSFLRPIAVTVPTAACSSA